MDKKLYYDNVALVPSYSEFESRKDINVSTRIGTPNYRQIKLPVIPANMKCVIDQDIARELSSNGYFYIMHRFEMNNVDFVQQAQNWDIISISVGVKDEDKKQLLEIWDRKLRVDFITIDIAHGDSLNMRNMLEFIKNNKPNNPITIIAGNVCTIEGYERLVKWGADIVKVGVGPGAACTTKLKTGFTYPMFSCIKEISDFKDKMGYDIPIIADGGITHNGDIAKALVAGADYVMCGKMFSECTDSPAPYINGQKLYFGSASQHNKNHSRNIEGKLLELSHNGMTYKEKLEEITQDLQSAVSYSGQKSVGNLWKTDWVII